MTKKTNDLSFAQSITRLEEIVQRLEEPNIDLEEGLKLLEEGVRLHKLCKSRLINANLKISTILKENGKEGD